MEVSDTTAMLGILVVLEAHKPREKGEVTLSLGSSRQRGQRA